MVSLGVVSNSVKWVLCSSLFWFWPYWHLSHYFCHYVCAKEQAIGKCRKKASIWWALFLISFSSFMQSAIGKEGIYLEDHDHVDRFSYRSNDPNNYSPSFYHFRPTKTSISRPGAGGSIRKESRPGSPFYKAGNSYTGRYLTPKCQSCICFYTSWLQ